MTLNSQLESFISVYRGDATPKFVYDINSRSTVLEVKEKYSGQSYKAFTIVIYDSRVVPDLKIPYITTLDS